jgi:two-component system, cell cycle sensor histidine kinase and response regulator CckA
MARMQQRGAGTILLAEDEAPLRELGETILRQAGYTVLSVPGPDELNKLIASYCNEVDLVLTDVAMPRISGQQVATLARRRWPQARIIYMSGYSNEELPGLDADGVFLQKPFTPAELTRMVQRVIAG